MEYYSRSRETVSGRIEYQKLEDHLNGAAGLAHLFADAFDSGEWGRTAGLWHDLGKYQAAFQEKLLGKPINVEHSGVGAALAAKKSNIKKPSILAYIIAGHHAGLPNPFVSGPGQPLDLDTRIKNNMRLLDQIESIIPDYIREIGIPEPPGRLMKKSSGDLNKNERVRSREFWIRFLFSALVDADRLDAEACAEPDKPLLRADFWPISRLRAELDRVIDDYVTDINEEDRGLVVNQARAKVLAACREASSLPPGLFSLTVPTGGGKTLSSMSFALNHAEIHDLRRVIVVIPYTSIIEQNAAVYRRIMGAENVVEHHSNLDPDRLRREVTEETARKLDLAAENWDAPVIVTTTVQFFESLFSNHPSRCRKIHNIAKSVVILDEVQSLPPEFLIPVVESLNELASSYGCSVVLSTATPPALEKRENDKHGLAGVRPIINDPAELSRNLERVVFTWPDTEGPPVSWELLADEAALSEQALVVTHRRNDARELAALMASRVDDESTVFHLSALNCPAHRTEILREVGKRLDPDNPQPCRLVSTQLIEAGVDVDFPIVFRALGGLDSMVQAAGRCNREGRLPDKGRVVIFKAPTDPPLGVPSDAYRAAEIILKSSNGVDLHDPELFSRFFRVLYSVLHQDAHDIQALRQGFRFADVNDKFRFIQDGYRQTIVAPYGDFEERLDQIRRHGPAREGLRALQPYLVQIHQTHFNRLLDWGAVEEVVPESGLFTLSSRPHRHYYHSRYGLVIPEESDPDATGLYI